MKKLMIAACAVAFAAVTHAASVSWDCSAVIIGGTDTVGWSDLEYAPAGWSVYFFDESGAVTHSQMQAALQADNFTTQLGSALLDGNSKDHVLIANSMGGGDFAVTGQTMPGVAKDTIQAYAVIFNADTAADATKAFLIDVQSADVNDAGSAQFVPDYSATFGMPGYVDAREGWMTVNNVPEPTSGLLLLLGVAGLALKRKRS